MMNKISKYELFCLTVLLCGSIFPGIAFGNCIRLAKSTSLISIFLGFIFGLFIVIFVSFLHNNIFGDSIFDFKTNKNIFIRIVGICILLISIVILFLNSWTMINFFISQMLTRNSYYVLAIVFFSIVFFLANKKIPTIGRVSIILFILFSLFCLFSYFSLIPDLDFNNLLPIFNIPKSKFLEVMLYAFSFASSPVFLLLVFSKDRVNPKVNYTKTIIWGYIVSIIFMLIYSFYVIGVYGVELSNLATYPGYYLYKKIKVFNFIERVENILISTFINCYFICFSVIVFNIKDFFMFRMKKYYSIVTYVISIFIPIISIYLFKKYYIYKLFDYYPYILFFSILLIVLCGIFLFIEKKIIKK